MCLGATSKQRFFENSISQDTTLTAHLDHRGGGNVVYQCNITNTFCCAGDPCQSGSSYDSGSSATISLAADDKAFTIIGVIGSSTTAASVTSPPSSTAALSSNSATSAETTTTTTNSEGSKTVQAVSETNTAPSSSSPAPTISSIPASASSPSTGAKIGIGIGVPLGVIAIALGVLFLWRRERRLKREMSELRGNWPPRYRGTGNDHQHAPMGEYHNETSTEGPYTQDPAKLAPSGQRFPLQDVR